MRMAKVFHLPPVGGDQPGGWYYMLDLARPVGPFATQLEAGKAARATIVDLAECSDCPPVDYPTDKTRCEPCPRRGEVDIPEEPITSYLVRWEIDVEATSPQAAAEKARAYQVKEGTTATVFDVFESGDHPSDTVRVARIDLSQPEESEHFTRYQQLSGDIEERTENNR